LPKKKGRGWWGERQRHSEAAKKGWLKRYSKLKTPSMEEIKERQRRRSKRARAIDNQKKAKVVLKPGDRKTALWMKRPGDYDIEGIDTPTGSSEGKGSELFNLPYIKDGVKFAKKHNVEVKPIFGSSSIIYKGTLIPLKWKIGENIYELSTKETKTRGRQSMHKELWVISRQGNRLVRKKVGTGEIRPGHIYNLIVFGVQKELQNMVDKKIKSKADDSWKKLAERYYREYAEPLGVPFAVIPLKFKKNYKRAGGITIFRKGKPVEVRLSEDFFNLAFGVNRAKADKILRFTIAHELAHIHLQHGKTRSPTFLKEMEANKLAEKISGVSEEEYTRLQMELVDEINRAVGREVVSYEVI